MTLKREDSCRDHGDQQASPEPRRCRYVGLTFIRLNAPAALRRRLICQRLQRGRPFSRYRFRCRH
ncbi:MAG TPA: hypothetical protein VIQ02_00480, partial [Jiangellaceae bacterium]